MPTLRRIRRRCPQCRLEEAGGDGGDGNAGDGDAGDGTDAAATEKLHPLLRRIFENRNVRSRHELDYQLAHLHAPAQLKGIDDAAAILHDALESRRKILVVGDYDVDGATASALALLGLRALGGAGGAGADAGGGSGADAGAAVDYLVPNRFRHGYGLSAAIAQTALQLAPAPAVVITVDNGIANLDGVQLLRDAGVAVVVTDHHLAGPQLPNASAIVNPNQPGCAFPSKALAGVGVMFYLLLALRARLRAAGWFGDGDGDGDGDSDGDGGGGENNAEPNLADFLDLVALGTVADLVPLDHNNRILVAQGVKRIRAGRCRPGIRALAEVAGRKCADLDAAALGFIIGPRLNAAGRMDDMSTGIECLLAEDFGAASRLAGALNTFNARRHQVEKSMLRQAEAMVAQLETGGEKTGGDGDGDGDGDGHSNSDDENPAAKKARGGGSVGINRAGLCLFARDWHQGITGLVASRVKDKFHRPVVAFAPADDEQLRGSARSVAGLHIRDLLAAIDARAPGLIDKFGGHAMAAGLTIGAQHFDAFARHFNALVEAHFGGALPDGEILTDGELDAADLTVQTAEMLRDASPWGQRFPPPLFDGAFRVAEQRVVGGAHLKMRLECNGAAVDAIAFRCVEPGADAARFDAIQAVYQLSVDEFRGRRRLQLVVEHLQPR